MKKLLAILLSALLCFSLTACGGDEIEGTWEIKTIDLGTGAVSIDEFCEENSIVNFSMTLIFEASGKCMETYSAGERGFTMEGTWEKNSDDSYTLNLDSQTMEASIEDDILTVDMNSYIYTFEK